MKEVGRDFLYQVNFPPSQAGKLANVRYEVLTYNGSVLTPATNVGVIEYGSGVYGVLLGFPEAGSWSIRWTIVGTSHVASEEINIYDDTVRYEGQGVSVNGGVVYGGRGI